jgi:hypothetical protein
MRTIFPLVDYVGENEREYGCGKKQEKNKRSSSLKTFQKGSPYQESLFDMYHMCLFIFWNT